MCCEREVRYVFKLLKLHLSCCRYKVLFLYLLFWGRRHVNRMSSEKVSSFALMIWLSTSWKHPSIILTFSLPLLNNVSLWAVIWASDSVLRICLWTWNDNCKIQEVFPLRSPALIPNVQTTDRDYYKLVITNTGSSQAL